MFFAQGSHSQKQRELALKIGQDPRLNQVRELGLKLLATGLRAGSTYPEVWIRDTNTFIEAALTMNDPHSIREALLNFFVLQGPDGDIVDGYVPKGQSAEPPYRVSGKLPGFVAFKNTVESDQECSLVSALRKYVHCTKDLQILDESVEGQTVRIRLQRALSYVTSKRWDADRGLVWGGSSVDWGDVQPEDFPGTHIDEHSHPACSIYANAMLIIAINDYLSLMETTAPEFNYWTDVRKTLSKNYPQTSVGPVKPKIRSAPLSEGLSIPRRFR